MQIRQHRPNFVDTDDPLLIDEFRTTEELLSIPWIKEWQEEPDFYRYSLTRDFKLMAELENGYGWWVIGTCFVPDDQE